MIKMRKMMIDYSEPNVKGQLMERIKELEAQLDCEKKAADIFENSLGETLEKVEELERKLELANLTNEIQVERLEELEAQLEQAGDTLDGMYVKLEIEADTCKWCGVIHERGMNTLCPLTIAETQLEKVRGISEDNVAGRITSSFAAERIQAIVENDDAE